MSLNINIKSNKQNINLDDLIVLGKRINNEKRNFLFISKVLGKHIEVRPKVCNEIGIKLAGLLYEDGTIKDEEDKICVLGFAETATGLGMAVAAAIKNSYYITTTREDITELDSILKFEEEHSHATTHKCFPLDKDKLINANKIIIVDDEITTGKSMINIIKELKKVTSINEFIVLSILDWRSQEYKNQYDILEKNEGINVKVMSLISGEIDINDNTVYIDNEDVALNESCNVVELNNFERMFLKTSYYEEKESYLCNTGRFGVDYKSIEVLENQCKKTANDIQEIIGLNKKVLVLGHGENIYIPCRIAAYLKGDIFYKSTTRSPIYCDDKDDYPIKEKHVFYHKDVKYYFYNKSNIENEYDLVVLITEDDLKVKLTDNMIIVKI